MQYRSAPGEREFPVALPFHADDFVLFSSRGWRCDQMCNMSVEGAIVEEKRRKLEKQILFIILLLHVY